MCPLFHGAVGMSYQRRINGVYTDDTIDALIMGHLRLWIDHQVRDPARRRQRRRAAAGAAGQPGPAARRDHHAELRDLARQQAPQQAPR